MQDATSPQPGPRPPCCDRVHTGTSRHSIRTCTPRPHRGPAQHRCVPFGDLTLGIQPDQVLAVSHQTDTWDYPSISSSVTANSRRLGCNMYETVSSDQVRRRLQVGSGYLSGRLIWLVPVMGTAVMSAYLHMAGLLGAKQIISAGGMGGLSPGLRSGDVVVPVASEGTHSAWMYHRAPDRIFHPDAALSSRLADRLRACGVSVTRGWWPLLGSWLLGSWVTASA